MEEPKEAPPVEAPTDPALTSVTKFIETDEEGNAHGIVNPHWMKSHDITVVGQFIKCLLESPEMKNTGGWIGIRFKKSKYGNPRVYYHGMTDAGPGKLESNLEYVAAWLNTKLVYMPIDKITYTDTFGKIDFIICLQGNKGDKVLSKVLEAARKLKLKHIVDEKTLDHVVDTTREVVNGVEMVRKGVIPDEALKPEPENASTSV